MINSEPILTLILPILADQSDRIDNIVSWSSNVTNSKSLRVHFIIDNPRNIDIIGLKDQLKKLTLNKRIDVVNFGNPGETRNYGLQRVDSTWFAFVDSDDYPHVKNMLKSIKFNCKNSTELIIGNYRKIDRKKSITKKTSYSKYKIALEPGIWRMIFKTSIFCKIHFEKLRLAEDQLFLIDGNIFNRKIKFVNETFYDYNKSSHDSLTKNSVHLIDLVYVVERLGFILLKNRKYQNRFVAVVYLKLVLSLIRRNQFKLNFGELIMIIVIYAPAIFFSIDFLIYISSIFRQKVYE